MTRQKCNFILASKNRTILENILVLENILYTYIVLLLDIFHMGLLITIFLLKVLNYSPDIVWKHNEEYLHDQIRMKNEYDQIMTETNIIY